MVTVITYAVYLGISVSITIWVASTLQKNGRMFLIDAFHGNEPLADSVNHLLVVGFYLLNLGYVSYFLKLSHRPELVADAIELLSVKIGMVLIVLGLMHFFNIYLFSRVRSSALLEHAGPVVAPAQRI